ncbi:unnamed protein product [Notodromas monacha]|uniref:Uncharacterized protein n=1 Tax=Notodromas monacha TaxID=399045 RepID=A0A7R9GK04_9CRUS|nr:unnamed protein product [Notodromas monacha]CAG0924114.1 unnamed protein product [Notodromas monacha]
MRIHPAKDVRRCVTDYEDCFVVRSGEKHPRYESIRNGRCNWLAVEIIQLFNNTNAVDNLLDNYGANDDEKCRKIQELFASCGLSDVHKESVEYNSKEILKLLNAHVQLDGVRSVLEGILKGLMVMA